MVISENTELGDQVILFDFYGRELQNVKRYNTETKEAEVYAHLVYKTESGLKEVSAAVICINGDGNLKLTDGSIRELITFRCHLSDIKVIHKITKEEITW